VTRLAAEMTANSAITPLQIGVLVLLALALVFAIVRRLIKTVLILALLVGAGALALYGESAGWFTHA
jgi:hypothetical protein